ncbi:MAG: 1-acyl-sn-glycerol-3-phosphate acyltransferase [Leptospiraceae bacterium]|nr:1-acyl-sn-glycerol-3-phosphate acyltransferase [Leptospiraceae bacterium]
MGNILPVQPIHQTITYRILVKIVYYTTKLMFHSVHIYSKAEKHAVKAPHPTILLANHVAETDIVALAHAYPLIEDKIKFCFAMRQDIAEPDFLVKEFEPKGFLKFILWLIDKTQIIKILLVYMGGIGVKRAFRDDARKLLKQGELRNLVDSQWDKLADGVLKGRNLFLFPEGKFSENGNLESIKRGTYLIFKRIKGVSYNYFNFTYDFIAESKPMLHIGLGEHSSFPENADEYELAAEIKTKLGNSYVLTQGNIFSFILFREDIKLGIQEEKLFNKLAGFLKHINSSNQYLIAKELLSPKLPFLFERFLNKAIKGGFLQKDSNGNVKGEDKLYLTNFRNGSDMRRRNTYLFHSNQLKYYFSELEKFYAKS